MRMPGRNRRVRLLAIAACIITIFFLYERNTASSYLSPSTVGGGSVLRKPDDDPHAYVPPPAKEPDRPAVYTPPSPEPVAEGEVVNPNPQPATKHKTDKTEKTEKTDKTDKTDKTASTGSSTATADEEEEQEETQQPVVKEKAKEKPLLPTLPPTTYDADDAEDTGNGAYLDYVPEDGAVEHGPVFYEPPQSSPIPVHWSKQPERWPVTSTIQLPTGTPVPIPRIQSAKRGADVNRLRAIKDAAKHAWKGYRDFGWGFDEVAPVSGVGKNSFNGWGATLVDSLDTLWIMGLKDEFEDAVNQTSYIDFTTSSRNDIPMFEVTIRYLGGLVAAYDVSGQKYRVLLDKAVELAEILYSAFDTPNRMPETYYYWKPTFASNGHRASTRVVLAELGTLSLEFTRLAQITKEPKYYDAVARITDALEEWQNKTRLPGMWPISVDASGCAKPVAIAPSTTSNQVPVPGGDSYMLSSEPVQASTDSTKKAKAALAGTSRHAEGFAGDLSEDVPNLKQASAELDSEGTFGADGGLSKRQLDVGRQTTDGSDLVDPRVKQKLGEAAQSYSPLDPAARRKYPPAQEEEPECIPQGLRAPGTTSAQTFTMGGQSDSVYEYLPKEYLLLGGHLDQYKTMYLNSMKPTIEKLMFRPMTPGDLDILISGEVTVQNNYTTGEWYETHTPKAEHLTCFIGGMLAMGGKIFSLPEHVEIGRKLTDGCIWSYNSTTTGIMPESFFATPCNSTTECQWNETEWHDSLDPYKMYREGQRANWAEKYGEQALLTWKPSTPEPYRPGKNALARNRLPEDLVYADDGHPTINTQGRHMDQAKGAAAGVSKPALDSAVQPKQRSGFDDLHKRQFDEEAEPAAPMPQVMPTKSFPTQEDESLVKSSLTELADDSADVSPPAPMSAPTALDDDEDPAMPIYTPAPPPTHEEYVRQKIEDERLPPGFAKYDSKKYILRPEAIESVFYMYRITGEQHWRDAGWEMFKAVEAHTRAEFGHSAIDDISKAHPEHVNGMESFWIAETLKYFYLLFDEEDKWSLDDWVLNTEAHFFRRPKS